jgi:dienelactone hydrolase
MRRSLVCALLIACGGSPPPPAAPPPPPAPAAASPPPAPPAKPTPEAEALEVTAQLAKGDFDAIEAKFSTQVAQALPHGKLAELWGTVTAKTGALASCGDADVKPIAPMTVVKLSCKFEKVTLPLVIAIDQDAKVAGLRVLPPAEPKVPWDPPPYAAKDAVTRDVMVGDLPGTLTLPAGKGPFPAVVLVHGSGPNDRDETIGPNKVFGDLALGLAAHGVASLRYDKRTKAKPETLPKDLTVEDEVIKDAAVAVDVLAHTPEISPKRIYVVGHSLGGYLAPRIAQETKGIAGLVIMAGPTRPLQDLFVEQLEYIAKVDGTVDKGEQDGIDEAKKAAARITELQKGAQPNPGEMLLYVPPSYWKDLAGYDPAAVAAKLKLPILVLQGARDYQVTTADFAGWKAALGRKKNVKLTLYGKLFHLFIAGDGPSTPAEYEKPGHVDEQVIRDIAAWISARSSR